MRINVYSQELERTVEVVEKVSTNGVKHYGIRIYFDGSPRLHNEPGDDDRSAITYWLPDNRSFSPMDLGDVFQRAANLAYRLGPIMAGG